MSSAFWSHWAWPLAAGAGVLALLGSRARLDNTADLYPAEMVGAALMLAGFLMAGTLERPDSGQEGPQSAGIRLRRPRFETRLAG